MSKPQKYGLLGKNISYSFSKKYFTEKFKHLNLNNCSYVNFDLVDLGEFPKIIENNQGKLKGLNVTIPYKEKIIPFLDELDKTAKGIGAVNTIKIYYNGKLKGYNTDVFGFEESLKPLLKANVKHALILGTGGASKAISYALNKLQISFDYVSRIQSDKAVTYNQISESLLKKSLLIINCTPLGTFPNIQDSPEIPYWFLTKDHILFDLVYNPPITTFMQKGLDRGAKVINGDKMLRFQADKSWEIWNS